MKKVQRNTSVLASLLLVSVLALPTLSFAVDENNVVSGFTAAGAPLGLHGVDPVASINTGSSVEGTSAHTAVHEGVAYYFSSSKNLAAFKSNPAQYIPQNGGFCTYGVAVGKKFDGDPQYASVVDGKLYVFLNEDIFNLYLKDKQGTIKQAETRWKNIRSTAAAEL